MLQYRTILHPTDFSEHSRYALEVATTLATACDSRLVILYVKEPLHDYGNAFPRRFEDQEKVLEQLTAQRPKEGHVRLSHQLVQGDAAAEIIRMARKLACELIVMGSHGRSGVQRLLVGSVAEEVARTAHCPVLIVRNGTLQQVANGEPVSSGRKQG